MNSKDIIEKFLEAQNRLVFQSSDLSLESIANMVEAEAINIKPKYQRRERWDRTKQSALIESFLLNIPVPPIFLAEDEYGKYSVIDGKQRITSIYNFISLGQPLQNLEKFSEIETLRFNDLPTQLNNALRIRPYVRVITLLKQSDPSLKLEVFNRLNTGGDRLLPQEIRNAAYGGCYNDLLVELSEHPFLRKQFNLETEKSRESSKLYREMLDVEYVLRFFTLRDTWSSFSGNMRVAMDRYMQKNHLINSVDLEPFKSIFTNTMEVCESIWGDKAFERPDGRKEIIQGIFDVQTVSLSFFVKDNKQRLLDKRREIKEAFEEKYAMDKEFENSIRQFTSNIKQVNYRISTMNNLIAEVLA
jgi:hypothetical protein